MYILAEREIRFTWNHVMYSFIVKSFAGRYYRRSFAVFQKNCL